MKIIQTQTNDNNYVNDEAKYKLLLAADLIEHFQPLFYEELRKKQRVLKKNRSEVVILKKSISLLKQELIDLNQKIKLEKIRKQIFLKIGRLISEGHKSRITKEILAESQSKTMSQIKSCINRLDRIHKTATNKTKV